MPAAAVIPAPIAYIKVVAVKKLVVGFLVGASGPLRKECALAMSPATFTANDSGIKLSGSGSRVIYCEKIRVFKAGICCEYISME